MIELRLRPFAFDGGSDLMKDALTTADGKWIILQYRELNGLDEPISDWSDVELAEEDR